jgi:hypothetical protein
VTLSSEFASVEIELNVEGNGPRLLVRDARSGRRILLDPLELTALAWTRHEELRPFLDPARLDRDSG